jgi:type VI secretion system protein ImpF
MPAPSADQLLLPSVFDRLMKRPQNRAESGYLEAMSLRDLRQAVARDLAALLNTRMWLPADARQLEGLEETSASIVTYGLPDLSSFSWANPQDCKKIASLVERAIRTFEPRLLSRSVRCEISASDDVADFTVSLHLEAVLHVDPYSEHVSFDSVADIAAGGIRIESFE